MTIYPLIQPLNTTPEHFRDCPLGTYSSIEGLPLECWKCSGVVSEDRSSCNDCPKGSFLLNRTCHKCHKGTYSNKTNAMMCFECPDGMTSEKEGSTSCQGCEQTDLIPNRNKTKCIRNEFLYKMNHDIVYDFSQLRNSLVTHVNHDLNKNLYIEFCSPKNKDENPCGKEV